MTVATKPETQGAQAASKRASSFRKFLLTSAAIAMIALPAGGLSEERTERCTALKQRVDWLYSECDKGRTSKCDAVRKAQQEYLQECTGNRNSGQDECQQLAAKSKTAADRCSQGYQPACDEYQKLLSERVEKCINDEKQKPSKPQPKPKRKAPAK